jgi:hypothetical protein
MLVHVEVACAGTTAPLRGLAVGQVGLETIDDPEAHPASTADGPIDSPLPVVQRS